MEPPRNFDISRLAQLENQRAAAMSAWQCDRHQLVPSLANICREVEPARAAPAVVMGGRAISRPATAGFWSSSSRSRLAACKHYRRAVRNRRASRPGTASPTGLGPLKDVPAVFRVAPCDLLELAGFHELLERVSPGRLG